MASYELKTFRRVKGDPLREESVECFAAPGGDVARAQAHTKTRDLSLDRVAMLYDSKYAQLATFDGAES